MHVVGVNPPQSLAIFLKVVGEESREAKSMLYASAHLHDADKNTCRTSLRSLERLLSRADETSKTTNPIKSIAPRLPSVGWDGADHGTTVPNGQIDDETAAPNATSSCQLSGMPSLTGIPCDDTYDKADFASAATLRRSDDKFLHPSYKYPDYNPNGRTTPLDPHNLMMDIEKDHSNDSNRLTRKMLKSLGAQFPVAKDRAGGEFNSDDKLSDPLQSIVSIANSGWDVDESFQAKRQAKHSTKLPNIDLHPEDVQLLEQWTPEALQRIMREQSTYFENGLYGCRRDVAPCLDPIQRNIITESRVEELFQM
jgi:hypothetical protein